MEINTEAEVRQALRKAKAWAAIRTLTEKQDDLLSNAEFYVSRDSIELAAVELRELLASAGGSW